MDVWWFEFPEQCMGKMKEIVLRHDEQDISPSPLYVDLFPTKRAALEALAKRLNELLQEAD